MVRTLTNQHPLYYEAILQLRDVSPAVVAFAEAEFLRHKIHLTRRVRLPNGWDYYAVDKNFTKALGKKLQQQFGGEQLTTASLYGQKDGKEIYRLTVLFREAPFKKGDRVEYRGEEYIVKILDKHIVLQPSKTGKTIQIKYKERPRIRPI